MLKNQTRPPTNQPITIFIHKTLLFITGSDTYLRQFLLVLASIVYPFFGYVFHKAGLESEALLKQRLFISAAFLITAIISRYRDAVKAHLYTITVLGAYLLMTHAIYMTVVNSYSLQYCLAMLLTFALAMVVFKSITHLLIFDSICLVIAILPTFIISTPTVNGGLLFIPLLAVSAVNGLILASRLQSQERLKESEDMFRNVFYESADALLILDVHTGLILDCNKKAIELFEASQKEALLNIDANMLQKTPFSAEELTDLRREMTHSKQIRYTTQKGNAFWGDMVIRNIQIDGNPFLLTRISDITERINSEHRLAQEEQRYRTLVENTNEIIYSLSLGGVFTYVSSNWTSYLGHSTDQVIGLPFIRFVHPEDIATFSEALSKIIQTGWAQRDIVYRVKDASGKWRWQSGSGALMRDTDGKPAYVVGLATDITERKQAEEIIRNSGISLSEAQKIAHLGSWELDLTSKRMVWSDETFRMFGLEPGTETPSFEQYLSMIHPEDSVAYMEQVSRAINEGTTYETEMRILLPDGSDKYVLAKGQPIVEKRNVTRLVGTILDINNRKMVEFELKKAKEEAEMLTHSKSEFLSNMSHEIRTPMNAIIGLTDMLLQEELKPQVRDNIRMIKYSSDNLLVIINDILDFSKIEAGKVTFEQVEFELSQLIQDLEKTVDLRAKEKGLRIQTFIDESLPKVLIGDPYRLNQILLNLASNAVKFTQQGQISIRAKKLEQAGEQVKLLFEVEDTGIGIASEELDKIFESFVQASGTTTREYGGTGLGLTITKKLVELQEGKISATSIMDEGSVFRFELFFKVSDKEALTLPEPVQTEDKNLIGAKILMVEDNGINQIVAKRLLTRWNAEIDIANDGKEALAFLRYKQYDVVLMDIHLPKMNGYEITAIIRDPNSEVLDHDVPIVALTADAFPETREKTISAGMDDFVIKPFEQNLFYRTIVRNLKSKV